MNAQLNDGRWEAGMVGVIQPLSGRGIDPAGTTERGSFILDVEPITLSHKGSPSRHRFYCVPDTLHRKELLSLML